MGTKLLFISDIHFGVKGNSEIFLDTIEKFFTVTVSKLIKENNITDVRILGDLFDNRNSLNVRTINSVIKTFRWYQYNLPSVRFKILIGNHDIYYHNRLDINSMEILREFPNVELLNSVVEETINGKNIISFPWLIKESEADLKFKEIYNGNKKYDLCLGHFEINGFESISGIIHEGGIDSGLFRNFKRVFTGHFHLRRTSNQISYLGCPYQITWGDYGDQKGIYIYDIDEETTEFFPNNDSPIFVRINFEDLIHKNMDKINQIKNNFVKLVIDKKYSDQVIVKALVKMESFNPLRLDVENNYIEEFDGENSEVNDINKLNDPLSFLLEYIKNIENTDTNIDKKEFGEYVSSLYNLLARDSD